MVLCIDNLLPKTPFIKPQLYHVWSSTFHLVTGCHNLFTVLILQLSQRGDKGYNFVKRLPQGCNYPCHQACDNHIHTSLYFLHGKCHWYIESGSVM